MAKHLKTTTQLVGRNEIKAHMNKMGFPICAGELEDLYYRMLALTSDEESDPEMKSEPSIKTEPESSPKVKLEVIKDTLLFINL